MLLLIKFRTTFNENILAVKDYMKDRKTKRNLIILAVFLIIVLSIVAVILASNRTDNNITISNTGIVTDENGNKFVNGLVTNNLERSYTRIEITFSLINADGKTIDTLQATTDFIPGGKTWEFTIPFQNTEVNEIKVQSISTAEERIK